MLAPHEFRSHQYLRRTDVVHRAGNALTIATCLNGTGTSRVDHSYLSGRASHPGQAHTRRET